MNKYDILDEHKTFKGFTNVSDNSIGKEYFSMTDGGKLSAKVPLSWKKCFSQGVVIPQKLKNRSDCKIDSFCDRCDELVNQMKEFSANLNKKKRESPNDIGHTLAKYVIT